MNYKKFALLAVAAGMVVGCGKTPAPAPDWSAEVKAFLAENFEFPAGFSVPFFESAGLGTFTYDVHADYGYVEIFGGELESSEPIKAAAEVLESVGFVDLYADYRDDPKYAQYVSEWSYPMEYRFEVKDLGPRYVRIGLSGKLPEENLAEGEVEEPKRSFYAQIFDPYTYTWNDSYSSDLIAYAFGSKDAEGYHKDATVASEIEPYLGQSTYSTDGGIYILPSGELYAPDVDDAIAEMEKSGYYRFYMQDIVREELDSYVEDLAGEEATDWDLFTYSPKEVQPNYLGHLYKLVSPSEYFTMDVYFARGEAMFLFAKVDSEVPEVVKDMEPALWEAVEVSHYDFEYFETQSGASGYSFQDTVYADSTYPSEEEIAGFELPATVQAAYEALLADAGLNAEVVAEFVAYDEVESQAVLNIEDTEIILYSFFDYQIDLEALEITYYFVWGIEVDSWPAYPVELTSEFIAAAGASNIHQFFEQKDGSFAFGKEVESVEDVEPVFNAIAALGGLVLTPYADGIGRVAISEDMMAVVELVTQTDEESVVTAVGYTVTVTAIPDIPEQAEAIAALLGVDKFLFQQDKESGAWFLPADESSEVLWADTKSNIEALFTVLQTLPGSEFGEPQVRDEDADYYGSWSVTGLYEGKMIVLQSVIVGNDADLNGWYSAQLIVCDPKEADPEAQAFMEAIATFFGTEVEFSPITGLFMFTDDYPDELSFDLTQLESALGEAFPDAEFSVEIEDGEYEGDYVVTILFGDFQIKVWVEDWCAYYPYYSYLVEFECTFAEASEDTPVDALA